MEAVPGDFMTLGNNARHGFRIALGNTAACQEGGFHLVGSENPQDAVNSGLGAVFRLGIFLVIHLAVLVRLDVLTTLEVKTKKYCDAGIARPVNFAVRMKFSERHRVLLGYGSGF